MTDLVQRARAFAVDAHRQINHRRKYSRQPYEVHLQAVAELVASVTSQPEMLAAAWLHDTVEDTPVTLDAVLQEFGAGVAALVGDLTDVSRPGDGNRTVRKAIDREHTARASPRAKTVKLADLIDNLRDIVPGDPGFARVFLAEAQALLAVLGDGDARLLELAEREVAAGRERLERLRAQPKPLPFQGTPSLDQARALRTFTEAIRARDLAEPLRWFDQARPASAVRGLLDQARAPVAGILGDGFPLGHILSADLGDGPCGGYLRPFLDSQVLAGDAPLADVIQTLVRHDHCFVAVLGQVGGLISRAGMQQPAVRMWLFGVMTLIELSITGRIRDRWPDAGWQAKVAPGRLDKARQLQEERRRRGQECDLLDCLQFADKARRLFQDPEEQARFGFRTQGAVRRAVQALESLRNNLAHSQDIVAHDWPAIAAIAIDIERVLLAFH